MLQRELADKAGQSSSSKNEAHTESQEYQKSESEDRHFGTIIQKNLEAYDSLESKKLKLLKHNENL